MNILPKPLHLLCALIGLGLLSSGCQTSAPRITAVEYKGAPLPSILGLQQEFLSQPDLMTRYLRLSELEAQALALAADEPCVWARSVPPFWKFILQAIPVISCWRSSIAIWSPVKLSNFMPPGYATCETTIGDADGSTDAPYKVMSINDARTFLAMQGLREAGALYQSNAETALGLTMLARENAQAPLRTQQFDLTPILQPLTADLAGAQTIQPNNPWPLLRELASSRNSAAQASIGTFLAKQRRFEAALGWLEIAARPGNLFANSLLARIYWFRAGTAQKQEQQQSPTDSDDAQPTAEEFKQMALENHLRP